MKIKLSTIRGIEVAVGWFLNGSVSLWKWNSSVILSQCWRRPAGSFLFSISDIWEASRGIQEGPKSFISSPYEEEISLCCSGWDFIWSRCVQSAESSTRRGRRSPSASPGEIKKSSVFCFCRRFFPSGGGSVALPAERTPPESLKYFYRFTECREDLVPARRRRRNVAQSEG